MLIACSQGHDELVSILLDNGANPSLPFQGGGFPLFFCGQYGQIKCAEILLKKGKVDVNQLDPVNGTALMAAAQYGKDEFVKFLIEEGADINKLKKGDSIKTNTHTAIWLAACHGQPSCIDVLLDAGADINQVDSRNKSCLNIAAKYGNLECLKILLKRGADINHMDMYGATPLITAAFNGKLACLQALIQANAELNAVTKNNATAVFAAAQEGK